MRRSPDRLLQDLTDALLSEPGALDPRLRRTLMEDAAGTPAGVDAPQVPDDLARYADTVTRHAYRVTDEDVDALRAAGRSEDAILEVTLSAALGAGLQRWRRGMAALRGEPSHPTDSAPDHRESAAAPG
jgi:alkylhydroperoxidase family enzyme